MFDRENAFYMVHQAEFQEKYPDQWLVIANDVLFGVFDTPKDAFVAAAKRYKPVEFMLHRPPDDDKVFDMPTIQYANVSQNLNLS
jgi:hypothetical protein